MHFWFYPATLSKGFITANTRVSRLSQNNSYISLFHFLLSKIRPAEDEHTFISGRSFKLFVCRGSHTENILLNWRLQTTLISSELWPAGGQVQAPWDCPAECLYPRLYGRWKDEQSRDGDEWKDRDNTYIYIYIYLILVCVFLQSDVISLYYHFIFS